MNTEIPPPKESLTTAVEREIETLNQITASIVPLYAERLRELADRAERAEGSNAYLAGTLKIVREQQQADRERAVKAEAARDQTKRALALMSDVADMLWVVVANVSGSDWRKQSPLWQEAALRWRDEYFKAVDVVKEIVKSSEISA